jgi:hypothetical protein
VSAQRTPAAVHAAPTRGVAPPQQIVRRCGCGEVAAAARECPSCRDRRQRGRSTPARVFGYSDEGDTLGIGTQHPETTRAMQPELKRWLDEHALEGKIPDRFGEGAGFRRMSREAGISYRPAPTPIQPKLREGSGEALRRVSSGKLGPADPLPEAVRKDCEARLGHDFRRVRIHAGDEAGELAERLGARAFTLGAHVAFAPGEYAPATAAGRRLLAHELTHVAQQGSAGSVAASPSGSVALGPRDDPLEREADAVAARIDSFPLPPGGSPRPPWAAQPSSPPAAAPGSLLQRQPADADDPAPRVSGDRSRPGPSTGTALSNGTLYWDLTYVGVPGAVRADGVITQGKDVQMTARFRPSTSASCPTVTFLQTVRPTVGGVPDPSHARLLETRDPASGRSADVLERENEPFYGAGVTPGAAGLSGESGATVSGRAPASAGAATAAGRGSEATFSDGPIAGTSSIPRSQTLVREFELAVICVETGETFGSILWGYTKTRAGVITLTGGRPTDVRSGRASAEAESTRQAFYAGHFQHSLGGFARGSSRLTAAHRTTLDSVAAQAGLSRIVLVGANDFSGGPEANATLSQERAEAARDYLVRQGVDASIIAVEGHGVEARVANPPGRAVAANRRVDVRVERGVTGTAMHQSGSARESMRLRRQNPRRTLSELGNWISEWSARGGRIPVAECNQLTHLLDGMRRWRHLDPSVPDVDAVWGDTIRSLRGRCESMIPRERPPFEPQSPPRRRTFIPRITESVEELPL